MRMGQKSKSIFNMKLKLIPLLLVIPLTACQQTSVIESRFFSFDTVIDIKLYEGEKIDSEYAKKYVELYSDISDNYQHTGYTTNIYDINQLSGEIEIYDELYDLLKTSFDIKNEGATYFNPLCGSLAKKWKESLKNQQILPENVINEELLKMNSSSIIFKGNNKIERIGEAEIDLGGIAKGYALDQAKGYLESKNIKNYLIDGGQSSILLGKKKSKDGLFSIGLSKYISKAYLKLKNCFVSTSGNETQGVTIDGVTYSHIVNPLTGSTIMNYDSVIVVSEYGYYGDAISTSMMMNTIDEIKANEQEYNVKTVVIKDNKIVYQNEGLKVYYH